MFAVGAVLLAVLLLVLLATLPAHVAWSYLQPRLQQRGVAVDLNSISGSVWNGAAKQAVVNGQVLGQLQWQIDALSLLTAPTVDVSLTDSGLNLVGELRNRSNGLEINNLRVQADAAWLAPALGIPALTPSGELKVDIVNLQMDPDGIPQTGVGQIQWLNAGVNGMVNAQFGNYQIALQPISTPNAAPSAGISGTISDLDVATPLSLTGRFDLQGRNYQASVVLTPNSQHPSFNRAIESALQYIGQPNQSGGRLLTIQGQLLIGKGKP